MGLTYNYVFLLPFGGEDILLDKGKQRGGEPTIRFSYYLSSDLFPVPTNILYMIVSTGSGISDFSLYPQNHVDTGCTINLRDGPSINISFMDNHGVHTAVIEIKSIVRLSKRERVRLT